MILFVLMMFLFIFIPYLNLIRSEGLDLLHLLREGKEELDATKKGALTLEIISSIVNTYFAFVALGAWQSVKNK